MEEKGKNIVEIMPEELSEEQQLAYYREAYFRERKKSANLTGRLADANAQVEDLSFGLLRRREAGCPVFCPRLLLDHLISDLPGDPFR
mgnify:CR=1 FL=1